MLLPPITTVSPCTDAPLHGLYCRAARHCSLPVAASRQYSARSPVFSLSRYDDATRTRSPTTLTGASTCHFVSPCCQCLTGDTLGSWSSLGGMANGSPF